MYHVDCSQTRVVIEWSSCELNPLQRLYQLVINLKARSSCLDCANSQLLLQLDSCSLDLAWSFRFFFIPSTCKCSPWFYAVP